VFFSCEKDDGRAYIEKDQDFWMKISFFLNPDISIEYEDITIFNNYFSRNNFNNLLKRLVWI